MAKKKIEKIDALIFIDTNIFLDFYRIRKSNISMKYLETIDKCKDIIITSSQVEMEFKKNRQSVIIESIGEIGKINTTSINIPTIISDSKSVELINKSKSEIEKQKKKIKERIEKILKNPQRNDPVYKSVQRLFKYKSDLNLNRNNKLRFSLRKLALKRFILGYPPRKNDDNSIGDAINWEWIINCSVLTNKNIIIVSRDSDYGTFDSNSGGFLNDWLTQEFKERTKNKKNVILTDKLSYAFQLVEVPVSKEMIEEEEALINYPQIVSYDALLKKYKASYDINSRFAEEMRISKESLEENRIKLFETFKKLRENKELQNIESMMKSYSDNIKRFSKSIDDNQEV
jgi:predicted nucleic acid-binding protein